MNGCMTLTATCRPSVGILGAVDRRHPARSQLVDETIAPERLPGERRDDDGHPPGRRARASATLCARSAALRRAVGVDERDVGGELARAQRLVGGRLQRVGERVGAGAGAMTAKSSPPRCTSRAPACAATAARKAAASVAHHLGAGGPAARVAQPIEAVDLDEDQREALARRPAAGADRLVERVRPGQIGDRRAIALAPAGAHQRLRARVELAQIEGLAQIVVGARARGRAPCRRRSSATSA